MKIELDLSEKEMNDLVLSVANTVFELNDRKRYITKILSTEEKHLLEATQAIDEETIKIKALLEKLIDAQVKEIGNI